MKKFITILVAAIMVTSVFAEGYKTKYSSMCWNTVEPQVVGSMWTVKKLLAVNEDVSLMPVNDNGTIAEIAQLAINGARNEKAFCEKGGQALATYIANDQQYLIIVNYTRRDGYLIVASCAAYSVNK